MLKNTVVAFLLVYLPCFSCECLAGISFFGDSAQTSHRVILQIPEFSSQQDAFKFANKAGGSEPLRRKLRARAEWFRGLANLDGIEWDKLQQEDNNEEKIKFVTERAAHYARQAEWCEYAKSIVENRIRNKVAADDAMIVVPDFTSKDDARMWAEGQHSGIGELREAFRKKSVDLILRKKQWFKEYGEAWYDHQTECLEAALKVLEQKADVGANFYAGCEILNWNRGYVGHR